MSRVTPVSALLAVAAAIAVAPAPALAQAQGIEVHGHWVIEVQNADGSLHSRREFQNALTADGQQHLANVLGRVSSVGFWQVRVVAERPSGEIVEINVREPDAPGGGGNLVVSVAGASVVLQGSFIAAEDFNVVMVRTRPDDDDSNAFTAAGGLDIPIHAGQTVAVKVTLSFS